MTNQQPPTPAGLGLYDDIKGVQQEAIGNLSKELKALHEILPFLVNRVSGKNSYLALPIAQLPVKVLDQKGDVQETTLEGLNGLVQLSLVLAQYIDPTVLQTVIRSKCLEGIDTRVITWKTTGNISFGFFAKGQADDVSDADLAGEQSTKKSGSGRNRR